MTGRTAGTRAGLTGIKAIVHALALAPGLWLAWQVAQVASGRDIDALGADPVAEITHRLGLWALRLLLITLALTPLRQLTGQAWPVQLRRMLGLYAFAYASAHVTTWLALDLGMDATMLLTELTRRPYITVGALAWLLLVPLALTSTRGWMRRLGRRWGQLHRLVYLIAILAVVHLWWLTRSDYSEPLAYATVLALLLGWRLIRWTRAVARR